MENLSPINTPRRHALTIANGADLQDHRFMELSVLPAVYALELMANCIKKASPDTQITAVDAIRFDKFLTMPPVRVARVDAYVDLTTDTGGGIEASLLTRHVAAKSGMTRMKVHARACFRAPDDTPLLQPPPRPVTSGDCYQLPADQLYAELVPFGPIFQQVVSSITLHSQGASAMVAGGDPEAYDRSFLLGSPFPLDAAFHIACAWAQRYVGIVAFPIAMQNRWILQPTLPGRRYRASARFHDRNDDQLQFDLWIQDQEDQLCEVVQGLTMRDVSGGRLQPPDWIRLPSAQ